MAVAPPFQVRAKVVSVNGVTASGSYNVSVGPCLGGSPGPPSTYYTPTHTVAGNTFTPWMVLDASDVAAGQAAFQSYFEGLVVFTMFFTNITPLTMISGEIFVDSTGATTTFTAELFGGKLSLCSWNRETIGAGTAAQCNQRFWNVVDAQGGNVANPPTNFVIAQRFYNWDHDKICWREGIRNMKKLGHNTILVKESNEDPTSSSTLRTIMTEEGISQTLLQIYLPPGGLWDYTVGQWPWPPTTSGLTAWANYYRSGLINAGIDPTNVKLFNMSDEPAFGYPNAWQNVITANDQNLVNANFSTNEGGSHDEFVGYLQARGLTPGDFGQASWSTVQPLGYSHQHDSSLANRKLYYWTMRFFPWASTTHFAHCTSILRSVINPNLYVGTNFNNYSSRLMDPLPTSSNWQPTHPDASMGAFDWPEFDRMGGGSIAWAEDWVPDSHAYQWSNMASRRRRAARIYNRAIGGYVVLSSTGYMTDGYLRKIMAIVGQGGKVIKPYHFGPKHQGPSDAESEGFIDRPLIAKGMTDAAKLIRDTEDLLFPGKPTANRVAILHPRSSQMFEPHNGTTTTPSSTPIYDLTIGTYMSRSTDHMLEVFGIYLALQHANIPVDWLEEDDLTAGTLSEYSVLYLTAPNIPTEHVTPITDWVSAGGVLWTTPAAGTADRYNDALTTIATLGGVSRSAYTRQAILGPLDLSPVDTVADSTSGLSASIYIGKTSVAASGSAVKARYADASPALIKVPVGSGFVWACGGFFGTSYYRSRGGDGGEQTPLPSFPATALRQLIARPVTEAGVLPPVELSVPLVEAPLLLSTGGAAIPIINWTNSAITNLAVRFRPTFTPLRVNSSTFGDLAYSTTGDGITFTIPTLTAVDVVRVYATAGVTPLTTESLGMVVE